MDEYKYQQDSNKGKPAKFIDLSLINANLENEDEEDQQDLMATILNNFFSNPTDKNILDDLISVTQNQPFPTYPEFYFLIIDLLDKKINIEGCIIMIEIIIHFPPDYYINFFPFSEIIQILLNFIDTSENAISILIFFIQHVHHFPNIQKIYLNYDVVPKIAIQLNNPNIMISSRSLTFFRYLLKTNLSFLPDYRIIYDKISLMAFNPNNSINLFSIHTIYHFIKKYKKFIKHQNSHNNQDNQNYQASHINQDNQNDRDNQNNQNNQKHHKSNEEVLKHFVENMPFQILFDHVLELPLDNESFLYFLMKFYLEFTRIRGLFTLVSKKLLKAIPTIPISLKSTNVKIIKVALSIIYNLLRDGRKDAFVSMFNDDLVNMLFENYYAYGFDVQKEIIFIFIEFSYYMRTNQFLNAFENYNMFSIFIDILLSDDNQLLEDIFICFLNIYDKFTKKGQISNVYKYFANEYFVEAIQAMDPSCSNYFEEFYDKLNVLLSNSKK